MRPSVFCWVVGGFAVFALAAKAEAPITAIANQTDAFNAGKLFGRGGMEGAAGVINNDAGSKALPNFTLSAPEAANFENGRGNVGGAGATKQLQCQNGLRSSNPFIQQECDAINFLSKNPSVRPKFMIDKRNDPILTGSSSLIKNPGSGTGAATQTCRVVNVSQPGTFTTETCEQTVVVDTLSCNKTLIPDCGYVGSPVRTTSTSQSGIFQSLGISATATAGLYDYVLSFPACQRATDGWGEINFSLDAIDQGGYLTLNVSDLDDAAAIAVNGYTVFAGYPNSGPFYSGSFFPQNTPAYQIGYTWSEKMGVDESASEQQFYANTKLLDFCPQGYAPTLQSRFISCDDSACSSLPSDTSHYLPGFFCNSEGKFLMNRHEGNDAWGGHITTQMPLRNGLNKIQVYWGTGHGGGACGNVTVRGQIYNVAPSCSATWRDDCASLRAAQ